MSESDDTWNAGGEPSASNAPDETQAPDTGAEPTVETRPTDPAPPAVPAAAGEPAWPDYAWPPTAATPTGATPTGPAPTAASAGDTAPTAETPAAPSPWAPWPTAESAPPQSAPQPYGYPQYAPGYGVGPGGAWPPAPPAPPAPPGWGGAGPHGWPQQPQHHGAPTPARKLLTILAAVALVLASAGIGAGVAIAVHDGSRTRDFNSANQFPSSNGGGFTVPTNPGGSGNGNTNPSGSGSLDMNAIANKVNPAIVNINTTLAQGRAAGTGMIVSSTGEIMTNNHVIADSTSIKVDIGGNGKTYTAKVVGYDVTDDIALLQITDKVSNLPTVTFGDPSKLNVGDPVVAIGNAGGRGGTPSVSQGQITALDQTVTAGDSSGTTETLHGMIQINAPIEPGDSGGALVDANAHVIGMNTAAAGGGRFNAASNIGFAIPVNNAVSVVNQIRTGVDTDKVHIGDRGLLGVQVQDVAGQSAPVSSGALVVGVQPDSGADHAGMQVGDVLVALNGKAIGSSDDLRLALAKYHPNESVAVGWVDSNGTQHSASVKLIPGPPL